MNLDSLKKRFDKLAIEDLEKQAATFQQNAVKNDKELITILFYLRKTRRFRENKTYKNSMFMDYLRDIYGMSDAVYYSKLHVYTGFEAEAVKHGPGFVSKVIKTVGNIDSSKVFKKIDSEQKKRVGQMPRDKKVEILKEFAPPEKAIAKGISRKDIEYELERTKKQLAAAYAREKEYIAQIEKLKETVERYKVIFATPINQVFDENKLRMGVNA